MSDRPILFSLPMVAAILSGCKTQTRRTLGLTGHANIFEAGVWSDSYVLDPGNSEWRARHTPFAVSDRLYVREEYFQRGHWEPVEGVLTKGGRQKWAFVAADDVVQFAAPACFRKGRHQDDPATVTWHKRLGRFMPRKASRLTLFVTEVRVERLQDCSEADAIAEGIEQHGRFFGLPDTDWDDAELTAVKAYHRLWNSINGAEAWEANPWVVAVSFDVRKGNIDD